MRYTDKEVTVIVKDGLVQEVYGTDKDIKVRLIDLDETDTEDLAAAGMVLSMISVQASLEVGKADKRLQSFSLDAADSLNSVIGLLGAFSEGAFDAEVESCLFSLNVNSYNDVSDIQVPQEAFAAERFDTDNVFALVDGL